MSYNWIDAATPQGRERLKELLDREGSVIGKTPNLKMFTKGATFCECGSPCYDVDGGICQEYWDSICFDGIEFLDPDPRLPIEALKAENERMRNALLDIEADARAKLASNLPLNSNETLHSVKHGLGQLLENGKSGDIGSVIDAIARTFKGDNDFCA